MNQTVYVENIRQQIYFPIKPITFKLLNGRKKEKEFYKYMRQYFNDAY